MASGAQVSPDTLITVKANVDGVARRFKLPLRDVGINVLESKLRSALNIPADSKAIFERYSDSAAAYVVLNQGNTAVYKQLYRAAKAKHKLKLRVTVMADKQPEESKAPQPASVADEPEEDTQPSVEPTDAEREPEPRNIPEPPTSTSEEPVAAEQAPEPKVAETEKPAKEGAHETPAPTDTQTELPPALEFRPQGPGLFDFAAYQTTPACERGCPAIRANYAVCCNSCDATIPDAHYHCSTCDDGDFDLCQGCVDRGVTCKGDNHWLIKRFVKNGVIINSTTERLAPKPKAQPQTIPAPAPTPAPEPTPSAPERIIPVFNDFLYSNIRTCNCCVQELPETDFVHCTTCDDYDLCRGCFAKNRHGHHPNHAFVPAVEGTKLDPEVARRLAAGRGQPHNAICDGCDNAIKGVRHKCLDCPDWDYCSSCVVNSAFIHPGHRFVPIYEPLQYDRGVRLRAMKRPTHVGICCDGPLCSSARANSVYIVGDRYKCAVCHDTDFCESCEASPANTHNRTHPLIKFRMPVAHVSVTTTGENRGRPLRTMGDRIRAPETTAPTSLSGIQTVVDVTPSEPVKAEEPKVEEPKVEKTEAMKAESSVPAEKPFNNLDLVAAYVRDTVADGTVFGPDHVFEQTWVMRNTGKVAWPAGCSVKFVGGDYMGHLDSSHPAATQDVAFSCESTICYAPVQPGEEFPFTVLLRTPRREGRVVSNWRLGTKDGYKFGHRLWCDVVVEKPKVVLPPPTVVEPVKQEDEKKEVVKTEPELEPEVQPEHSQMIFPKLEKESPVASVHEEATKAESLSIHEDEYEDCEDVDWNEDASEEGFLTDEEYDVLDASDEEFHDGHAKRK
ncbi:hypothetical protein VTI74DRAFT_6187 [Chaetomium olivicolor]